MARPSLPLGTAGKVRTYKTARGWRARTLYRDFDGKTRHVEASGRTKAEAERRLVTAVRDRVHVAGDTLGITPDTKVEALAEMWFTQISAQNLLAPSTIGAYRARLDRQILPALGSVRVRELTVGTVDRHLLAVRAKHGAAVAKTTRSVLSAVCGLATRHDALDHNPCRDTSPISTKPRRTKITLDADDTRRLLLWLANDERSTKRDLPGLVSLLVGTGMRIGEALALTWTDVDLEAGTVEVRGTVQRAAGAGTYIKPQTKTSAGERTLELPAWVIVMLTARKAASGDVALVFPGPSSGEVRDPSNTQKMLRQTFDDAGYPGLTSHAFRRGVATLMDQAGLSSRAAADQLGHSRSSLTQDVYFARKLRSTGAAGVLEILGRPLTEGEPSSPASDGS